MTPEILIRRRYRSGAWNGANLANAQFSADDRMGASNAPEAKRP
jgi:hypothetical protein